MNSETLEARHFVQQCMAVFATFVACIATGLLGSLVMSLVVLLLSQPAHANTADEQGHYLRKQDVQRGSLLLKTAQPGIYLAAPAVRTHVDMQVHGMLARVRVEQVFHNPSQAWVEGEYVFPLPDGAAVDDLTMYIGDRVIKGVIKPHEEARKVYEQAKRTGRKASLVTQQRPNMFSNNVANIAPGEQVRIEIAYQQQVDYRDHVFSLRYPLVVGPRYTPLATAASVRSPAVPQTVVRHPATGKTNPVTIQIRLEPGVALQEIESPYHAITQQRYGAAYDINLAAETIPADRDFELRWTPQPSQAPQAALFVERLGQHDHGLLMIMPPVAEADAISTATREVIYVIDTSGSMGGASIRQARAALLYALRQLRPGDSFNIIEFNSRMQKLYPVAVPATAANLHTARSYVEGLQARGGTEMRPALLAALQNNTAQQQHLRQVIFITDGSVSNEEELFRIIHQRLGNSRLFTVGIGSAPNNYFMRRAAQFGRGSYTHIGKPAEVETRMNALFGKLSRAVLGDVQLNWSGTGIPEQWPRRIPDLYAGEPLLVAVRMENLQGTISVSGQRNGVAWSQAIPVQQAIATQGVARHWARQKIASLMDSLQTGASPEQVKQDVTRLALQHHLVSRYTSLVAVDVTPSRPDTEPLVHKSVPLNLPAGWQYEKVFGNLAQTATPAAELLRLAWWLMLPALFGLWYVAWPRWRAHRAC
jgi:Ca-activated chloride channel family protein